ncbi:transposon TX1 [Tanacetum coccineum]|uniref:Transposon TX1 n=1 Tax=Tanacetum coccineum TaxID=301880 RepID=A0ABQ5IW14_9ASTR
MRRKLFNRIVRELTDMYPYFQQTIDVVGRCGIFAFVKYTFGILQLTYGFVPYSLDEYLQIGNKTARDCLVNFCNGIMKLYGHEYLRKPTQPNVENFYAFHEENHGFHSMIGSIDCTKWPWSQFPIGLRGQFHKEGKATEVAFVANDMHYKWGYYLTGGIYPEWLEGNQNLTYGRIHIHTINKGLIKDVLNVTVKGRTHKKDVRIDDQMEENVMKVVDEGEKGESDNEEVESSEEEDNGETRVVDVGGNEHVAESDDRDGGEDEGLRFSRATKVSETFEEDCDSFKALEHGERKMAYGEGLEKETGDNEGDLITEEPSKREFSLASGKDIINDATNRNGLSNNERGLREGPKLLGTHTGPNEDIVGNKGSFRKNSPNEISGSSSIIKVMDKNGIKNIKNYYGCREGNKASEKQNEDLVQDCSINKKDKCKVSPFSLVGSGADRLRKKQKASDERVFEGIEVEMIFNQGKKNKENSESKKKIGRSVMKAIEVAKKTEVVGLGENKKGISDVYKEYHEVQSGLKEIEELIGVSWTRSEEEEKEKELGRDGNKDDESAV